MFTKKFWKAATERAIRAGANVAVIALTATTFTQVGEVVSKAEAVGVGSGMAIVISLLMSIAAGNVGAEEGTPSFTANETISE